MTNLQLLILQQWVKSAGLFLKYNSRVHGKFKNNNIFLFKFKSGIDFKTKKIDVDGKKIKL